MKNIELSPTYSRGSFVLTFKTDDHQAVDINLLGLFPGGHKSNEILLKWAEEEARRQELVGMKEFHDKLDQSLKIAHEQSPRIELDLGAMGNNSGSLQEQEDEQKLKKQIEQILFAPGISRSVQYDLSGGNTIDGVDVASLIYVLTAFIKAERRHAVEKENVKPAFSLLTNREDRTQLLIVIRLLECALTIGGGNALLELAPKFKKEINESLKWIRNRLWTRPA